MMERIERKMKNLLLASIGAAAVTREQSEDLVHALVEKGEEVIDRSGIRNECLRFNDEASEAGDTRQSEAAAWLEQLCNMSPEQLQVLRDAISAVESASSRVDECEGEQHVKQA